MFVRHPRRSHRTASLFFITAVILIGMLEPANAILNVESIRLAKRNEDSGGTIGASFDRSEGNSDSLRYKLTGQAIIKNEHFEHIGMIERNFGTSRGTKDLDSTVAHLRTTWPRTQEIAAELYGQAETNPFNRLSLRGLIGTGARFRIVNQEQFVLYTGAGVYWSRETLENVPGTSDGGTEDIWRESYYISLLFPIAKNVDLINTAYFQPAMGRLNDHRILETAQARMKVNDRLSVTFNYSLNYDSQPPQNVQSADQSYGTAINWEI